VENIVASGKSSTKLKEVQKKTRRVHDNISGGMTSKSKTLAASSITLNTKFIDLKGLELESVKECNR
jgi:hypothetical protein